MGTEFPGAFGNVQRDRRGSPLELIAKVGRTSRETFYDIVRKRQELDRSS